MGTLHYSTAVTRQTRKDITSKKDGSTGVEQGEGTGGWMTCGLCVHLIQAKVKEMKGIVDISVEGMTCQSCVKVITAKLQEVEGVMQAEVSLEEKQAYVEFDPGQTTAESLVKVINGMGTKFTASLTQRT